MSFFFVCLLCVTLLAGLFVQHSSIDTCVLLCLYGDEEEDINITAQAGRERRYYLCQGRNRQLFAVIVFLFCFFDGVCSGLCCVIGRRDPNVYGREGGSKGGCGWGPLARLTTMMSVLILLHGQQQIVSRRTPIIVIRRSRSPRISGGNALGALLCSVQLLLLLLSTKEDGGVSTVDPTEYNTTINRLVYHPTFFLLLTVCV